jgi:hypothetical protein
MSMMSIPFQVASQPQNGSLNERTPHKSGHVENWMRSLHVQGLPVVVWVCLLLQRAELLKLPGDQQVPRELAEAWEAWLKVVVHKVPSFSFQRCITPDCPDSVFERHHFI